MGLLLILLTLLASLSPLLTLAKLWQVKEWRIDRLKVHLRSQGIARQLFGITRPLIILGGMAVIMLSGTDRTVPLSVVWIVGLLGLLSIIQIILRKQPYPVWTKKALALVTTSATLTILISFFILHSTFYILPFVILLQPLILTVSWIIFWPIDRFLKKRILRRAMVLRKQHPDLTVIGITGSVGKTTTKELLSHILKDRNPRATPAYVNSEMGVAQWMIKTLSHIDPAPATLIIEMGAYRRGEIKLLCDITKPQMGIITFIGSQHMALFGSQEALCKAKAELLEALPEEGHAFLNADNEMCDALSEHCKSSCTKVGTGGHEDLEAFDIEETSDGIRFRVSDTNFSVPLHGTHNVTNVLLCIAAAEKLGMSKGDIAARLRSFSPPSHTFSIRKEGSVLLLDDTHNASPESFKAAIAWARTQPAEHKILLTPGLIELGEREDDINTELGTLSDSVFDRVIFLNKKSAQFFALGYKKNLELLSEKSSPVPSDSLLVCIGRMTEKTIQQLLPKTIS